MIYFIICSLLLLATNLHHIEVAVDHFIQLRVSALLMICRVYIDILYLMFVP